MSPCHHAFYPIFLVRLSSDHHRVEGLSMGEEKPRVYMLIKFKGFTYLTPVSLIPHHLASLWKSSVGAVVSASLLADI